MYLLENPVLQRELLVNLRMKRSFAEPKIFFAMAPNMSACMKTVWGMVAASGAEIGLYSAQVNVRKPTGSAKTACPPL